MFMLEDWVMSGMKTGVEKKQGKLPTHPPKKLFMYKFLHDFNDLYK